MYVSQFLQIEPTNIVLALAKFLQLTRPRQQLILNLYILLLIVMLKCGLIKESTIIWPNSIYTHNYKYIHLTHTLSGQQR